MKSAFVLFFCALLTACVTTRSPSPRAVLRQADPVLGRVMEVRRFEGRLNELGAKIEMGPVQGERVATVPLLGKPGYFPPRTLRVVYVVTDDGLVDLRSAEMKSLGSPYSEKRPNKSPEPTSTAVTPRASRMKSEMKNSNSESDEARVAPAAAVAHL